MIEDINMEDHAIQLLDPPISLIYNADSTYVLCIGSGASKSNPLSKSYCVLDDAGNLISEKRTIHGTVGWSNSETLMLESMPRVVNKREAPKKVVSYININEANAKSK